MPNPARVVVGRDGRIALVNKPAEKLLGARAQDLLGLRSEAIVPDRHRERHIEQRDRYLAEPWSPDGDYGFFLVVADRSGRERRLFAVPEPIASEDGLWVSILLCRPEDRGAAEVYRFAGEPAPSDPLNDAAILG